MCREFRILKNFSQILSKYSETANFSETKLLKTLYSRALLLVMPPTQPKSSWLRILGFHDHVTPNTWPPCSPDLIPLYRYTRGVVERNNDQCPTMPKTHWRLLLWTSWLASIRVTWSGYAPVFKATSIPSLRPKVVLLNKFLENKSNDMWTRFHRNILVFLLNIFTFLIL